ncbi:MULTISPECIES: hypothetical protein [Haloferax]|uniref:Uncharacterized protein n=1 Tax=Haloferax marinum TaxID=2666143 RepID=A0A6A8GCX9_9EURY|nr:MULTISPECIES: hypothetical protein [Haloferax]KAB1198709.1 hypothetical protein Hfx1150_14745 [Haloferax sp. CBA1150]MRW97826.1 hypothetical protein [Haloferax marinum]
MNTRTLGIVAVALLVVVAVVGGGLWTVGRLSFLDSYGSEYDYTVRVSADEQITNVTIFVPLPVYEGHSEIGAVVESRDYLKPDAWSYDVVETRHGPMLRLRADELPGEPTYHRAVIEDDRLVRWEQIPPEEYARNDSETLRVEHDAIEVNARLTVDRSVDTKSPARTEPVLHPRSNPRAVPCDWPHDSDETQCYSYDSLIFVEYDGPETTRLTVTTELSGTNSWWVGGWNFNEYTDRITVYDLPADQRGWVVVEGELQTGVGNYPRNPPQ